MPSFPKYSQDNVVNGKRPLIHSIASGRLMWDKCGMARNRTGLEHAIKEILGFEEFGRISA
jgi:hypothetical protein